MGKYRKILIAFDGSPSGKNALRQAVRLADAEKAWMKVVAVVPSYEGEIELIGVKNISEVLRGPGEKLLREAEAIAKEAGATVMTDLEQGEPYERIVSVARDEKCDLIVMGRRGISRFERALLGSVTARVIGHTDRDVLVVPRDASVGWDSIVLATDGSSYSEAAARKAIDFAKSYGGRLFAVSVVDVTEEFYAQAPEIVDKLVAKAKDILEAVKKQASAAGVAVDTAVKEGETYEKIAEAAMDSKAGVIVMGSHGRTGIKRLLLGSVTEKVIGHASCPVLVVKS